MRASATGGTSAESSEVAELNFLLNGGTPSKRSERASAQEELRKVLIPTGNELRVMSVQQAVAALIEHVDHDAVVIGCCERWQALGYGPGRRQSAADSGALPAIVAGMHAHASKMAVQEKACIAIANICSGTDEAGLARKAAAFDAGAVPAIVAAILAHPGIAAVQANGSAALGNSMHSAARTARLEVSPLSHAHCDRALSLAVCYAGDDSGLRRKHAAFEAGAIAPIVRGMEAHGDDASVCENGAFALGNLCRALGKVGNSATGDFAAPELASIDEQLRQRTEGQQRKGAAAEAGALEAIVRAMLKHESVEGLQQWGSRALSIITYESTPLRERAKQAGAKMTWLMGLSESMESAQKARVVQPVSKTGRPAVRPALGARENAPPTRVPACWLLIVARSNHHVQPNRRTPSHRQRRPPIRPPFQRCASGRHRAYLLGTAFPVDVSVVLATRRVYLPAHPGRARCRVACALCRLPLSVRAWSLLDGWRMTASRVPAKLSEAQRQPLGTRLAAIPR